MLMIKVFLLVFLVERATGVLIGVAKIFEFFVSALVVAIPIVSPA